MNFKNMGNHETMYCGRRPKNENIEPSVPLASEEEQEEAEEMFNTYMDDPKISEARK